MAIKIVNKGKFIRNILIGIISLIIVSFIINTAPGYKRNKFADITNLVITDANVTENLKNKIYINENGTVYLSKDDMQEFFDSTIYYDETYERLITTSDTKVASMKIGEKQLETNGAIEQTLDTIIYIDNVMYVPLSELEAIYNIDVNYIKEADIVVVDYLNKGMITAEAFENTEIKFKPRSLSKKVGELSKGDRIYAFYTSSKGWRLIRTEQGLIGYVKANTLTNEYILRQDMEYKEETKEVSMNIQDNTLLSINSKKVLVKDLFTLSDEGILIKDANFQKENENIEVWANLSNNTNLNLSDYNFRANLVKDIISIALKYDIDGINVNFNENQEGLDRFVIELSARLREMGVITNIVINEDIDENSYIGKVEYLIKN